MRYLFSLPRELVFALLISVLFVAHAGAQVEAPDRRYLFREDQQKDDIEKKEKNEQKQRKKLAQARQLTGRDLPFDINAKDLSFDAAANKLKASGSVIITYGTLVAEAQRAEVNVESNVAELIEDVRITDLNSEVTAEYARIDLKNGAGELEKANILFTEGNYRLYAEEVNRAPGEVYTLNDALLSTCNCPEKGEAIPWSFHATEAEITREGYGFAYNSTMRIKDFPALYLPFLVFPAKSERQSGLLPMSFGGGRRSGLDLRLPIFWVFDESTDATTTGIFETKIRTGVDVEYRQLFSRSHRLQLGGVYLNEAERDGELLGTNVDDLDEPTLEENRFGGYINHRAKIATPLLPLQWVADGAYVTDDLFIREYEKQDIAPFNSRFVTSRAALRAPLPASFSADLSAEFNQAIAEDSDHPTEADDFVFQRLPELNITGINSFRPFGENPLGLKLVFGTNTEVVNFVRKEAYDGTRSQLAERVTLPFHFRNYFDGSIEGNVRLTKYNLSETALEEPNGKQTDLPSSSDRVVPGLQGKLNTVVEKVFPLEQDDWLRSVGELGRSGRTYQLSRVKHTIEPGVRYRFVPTINQDDNPQFDSEDQLARRNVGTVQLVQRLLGRFEPRDQYLYGIEEVTPELQDLGNLGTTMPWDRELTFGFEPEVVPADFRSLRRGSIVELARFTVSQSLDVDRERKDEEDAQSDLDVDLMLFPNEHLRLRARTDYDVENTDFSSYSLEGQLMSKRGDGIRSRLRFVEDSVRQLESSAELRVTDFIKLGYYSRYDDLAGEFIEQKGGVRLASSCNCWVFDINVSDRTNPDETRFSFSVTLVGLGELGNTFLSRLNENERKG